MDAFSFEGMFGDDGFSDYGGTMSGGGLTSEVFFPL
jgi:hypothetical protein